MQNIVEIEELIKLISKLPGLGPRSAKRIVLKMINNREELIRPLIEYKEKHKDTVFLIKNVDNNTEFRTVRIAKARNACLDIVYNKLKDISFHIMIDSDDSCSRTWKIDIIDKDTYNHKNNFFSARRSIHKKENDYGRNISIIMIN